MDDLISREDALKALDEMSYKSPHESATSVVRKKHFGEILEKFIMQQPSAQQWIPCSERLPDQNGKYLVVGRQKAINILKFAVQRGGIILMDTLELTKGEAYSVAEFIDFNLFTAIRNDVDWDSMRALRNLIHVYEKCCILSGYFGCTDTKPWEDDNG